MQYTPSFVDMFIYYNIPLSTSVTKIVVFGLLKLILKF